MDVIWGNTAQYTQVYWGWEIAVYLFLAGLSAGALILSILIKWKEGDQPGWDGLVRCGSVIAPLAIMAGLALLIVDLGKPLAFYLLMLHYQLSSVMSIGVVLLMIYTPLSLLYAVSVYKYELAEAHWSSDWFRAIQPLVEKVEGRGLEYLNLAFAVGIGSYTGFLLSALVAKPLLNNAVLPLLFLVSGLSAGIAAAVLMATLVYPGATNTGNLRYALDLDLKAIGAELFVLFLMFVGLYYHGGIYAEVVRAALTTGLWANVFWLGVVGLGLIIPIVLAVTVLHRETAAVGMTIVNSLIVLTGGLLLRFYVLYAGQSFIGN